MSRATVRAAVASYLAPANVAGLANLFNAVPKFSGGQAYFTGQGSSFGNGSGAQGLVHIAHQSEHQYTVGPVGVAKKFVTYEVAVVTQFKSSRPDKLAYMGDYDTLIDNMVARIRQGRAGFGTTGPNKIFVVGEAGPNTPPDIILRSDLPRQLKGSVYIWSAVEFLAKESITA